MCERFRTNCCISPTSFKKPTILPEIIGFLKLVGEIQQYENVHRNFALSENFRNFRNFTLSEILPYSKPKKTPKKLSVFGESDSRCLSNFLQSHIFEILITFLGPTIKLITGIFDLQK